MMTVVTALFLGGCGSDENDVEIHGSIYGIVVEHATGEPIRTTGVELFRQSDSGEYLLVTRTVTGNEGQFEFRELVAGRYRLNVLADEFLNTLFNVEVRAGIVSRMDMQLERRTTGLTVRTLYITEIGVNSAMLNGNVSWTGEVATEQGFVFATHNNPADGGTRVTAARGNNNNFSTTITDLRAGTYYVQAYATNAIGTEFGEVRSFVITGVPVVTTLPVTNITTNSATLNGRIDFAGDPAFVERGFIYSTTNQNPTMGDVGSTATKIVVSGTGTDFSANLSELPNVILYHVRAFATNSAGTVYGESISFSVFGESVVINGVRWATRNVAITGVFVASPEIAGAHFQWNRRDSGWTSNWNGGGATTWQSANDPCPVGWRVPTEGELNSLVGAGSIMVTNWNNTGVSGLLFGTAPYQIFLPAAGHRDNLSGSFRDVGRLRYWGASLVSPFVAVALNDSSVSFRHLPSGASVRCVADN